MEKIILKDGTPIAVERLGSGPALILVDGAMCSRGFGPMPPLAKQLASQFTVYHYHRRGRGDSGNGFAYDVQWANAFPNAVHQTLPGQTHMARQDVLAPALIEFFALASEPAAAKELAPQR